ncbi:hypothetical protein OPV22_013500 [Ensete ventricosum]|uniref:Uncharacterized protein n=1 Tax=Ensete ventricosum TaxID=4639 RepID=A0AAV8PN92_ENSVE|nr:hypothetical protein OPV22_013500 [Ensete ventricosum]
MLTEALATFHSVAAAAADPDASLIERERELINFRSYYLDRNGDDADSEDLTDINQKSAAVSHNGYVGCGSCDRKPPSAEAKQETEKQASKSRHLKVVVRLDDSQNVRHQKRSTMFLVGPEPVETPYYSMLHTWFNSKAMEKVRI